MVEEHKLLKYLHLPIAVMAFLLVASAAVIVNWQQTNAHDHLPDCDPSVSVVNPAPSTVVDGAVSLELYVGGGTQLDHVKFFLDDDNLGNANPVTGSPGFWKFIWNTESVSNDTYPLVAKVRYQSTSLECLTPSQPIIIDNPSSGGGANQELKVDIIPSDWTGPTNVNFQFEAAAFLEDSQGNFTDVSDNTNFTWSTNIGSVNSQGRFANFSSGPNIGEGEVSVVGQYGTQAEDDDSDVTIVSNSTGFPYPEVDDNDDDGSEDRNKPRRSSDGSNQQSSQGDRELSLCILERLGRDDYRDLVDNSKRFSFDQFEKVQTCFARRAYIIPSNLAPVDPEDLRGLPEDTRVKIEEVRNVSISEDGKNVLELNGVVDQPDRKVVIYIYSEPLVLTTTADNEGRWTYTLEDPLEAGDHEAYVMVETEEGFKRSGNFAFAIAQAESTADNPNGFGLTLATASTSQDNTNLYLALAGGVVLVAAGILTRFVWFKRSKPATPNNSEPLMGSDKTSQQAENTPQSENQTGSSDEEVSG